MSGLKPASVPVDDVWRVYIANLRFACETAAAVGMNVLVEPIGVATIAGYLVDHPDLAPRAKDEVDAPSLSTLFDTFHATNAGVDAVRFLREHHARIAHFPIADHPGRHEPGTGAFDFRPFFDASDDVGYAGAIGLEYVPAGDTAEGLAWHECH